jgi:arginine N-succinyltransferase
VTFRIRQSYRDDVDQVLAVAEHLDTVNLPAERDHIAAILERSEKAFNEEVPPSEREFLFVLEDLSANKIIGTSIIYAQHGTKRAPHIFFRVEDDERYSVTLDKHMVHQTLRIGYNYNGPTEIGGLILLPEYRRSSAPGAESLGKALSFVRFLFMRMHRPWFRNTVLSELLPPLEPDGTSKLWKALGKKFTGLTYQEADLLSRDNKEFIHALFPDDPIHTELFPDDVREEIGQVGPATKGVEAMLRRIGFEYAYEIDPFDGGPHFTAPTDKITVVANARELPVRVIDPESGTWSVVAVELPGAKPRFRAVSTKAALFEDTVAITADACRRLGVEAGQKVWLTSG